MSNLNIVMPAYNEEENISQVVKDWHDIVEQIGNQSKLIIVDDGSTDDTYSMLLMLAESYPHLVPVTKPNSGHGPTCLFAYQLAIKNEPTYVFQTDSDGQTLADEFWKFWELKERYDLIVGSRKERQDGLSRIVVTKTLKAFVLTMTGLLIEDANTPFRLIKTAVLKQHIRRIPEHFFLPNVLMCVVFKKMKERCIWLPIQFRPRQGGVNSINLLKIIKIGFKAIRDFQMAKQYLNRPERI